MKKIEIDKVKTGIVNTKISEEVEKLKIDKIDEYISWYIDGLVIEKKSMSNYVLKCYEDRIALSDIQDKLTYYYYVDNVNNSCILFARNEDNEEQLFLKEDSIVVELYISPEQFKAGSLACFYQNEYVYYDEFPIFRAVAGLLTYEEVVRKITIDNIIK